MLVPGCRHAPEPTPGVPAQVLAWLGPPPEQTTAARYHELADAGFNTSFTGFPDVEALARALEVAHGAGIRLLASCPELEREPESTVRRFKDHPGLAGYYLRDEPSVADFAALGAWVRRIRGIDEEHPCYVNLFPTYASAAQLGVPSYREYVRRFLDEVPVQVLSFDHYPIVGDRLRDDWYENLEIIALAAKRAHRPFWAFALSVAHDPYPVATVEGLRLQAFSNLAYGAGALQYFTYWTPRSDTWNFHEAPIAFDGSQTPVYARVRQVNEELQPRARLLRGALVLDVAHAGETLPKGTHRFEAAPPIVALDTGGRGAVIARQVGRTHEFLVVVNRELTASLELAVRFEPEAGVVFVDAAGATRALERGTFRGRLAPGDMRLFAWER
jgi:hypothetical protein